MVFQLFLPRDAMLARYAMTVSVRLSHYKPVLYQNGYMWDHANNAAE